MKNTRFCLPKNKVFYVHSKIQTTQIPCLHVHEPCSRALECAITFQNGPSYTNFRPFLFSQILFPKWAKLYKFQTLPVFSDPSVFFRKKTRRSGSRGLGAYFPPPYPGVTPPRIRRTGPPSSDFFGKKKFKLAKKMVKKIFFQHFFPIVF